MSYQCINELWLYNSSNFAVHYNYYNFFSKHCIKRVLDIEMNSYHVVFLRSVDPKQPKNVKFSLRSIIETSPRGGAWLFRGGAKILRGGAKRFGRCAPLHKIRPCTWLYIFSCTLYKYGFLCNLRKHTLVCFWYGLKHSLVHVFFPKYTRNHTITYTNETVYFTGDNHGGHYVVYINPKGDGKVQ
jgi:hypothetical protein